MIVKLFFNSLVALVLCVSTYAQVPVPMASQPGLTYTENFADIAAWTNNFTSGIGANRYRGLPVEFFEAVPHPRTHNSNTMVFVTGNAAGVQKGTLPANGNQESIILLAAGASDNFVSSAIDLYLDFSGAYANTLSFDWQSINNSTGNRRSSLLVYGTVDGENFVQLSGASVLNFVNNSPSSGSVVNVPLPPIFHNSPNARLRFYCYNGTGGAMGSRPKLSIDNIVVRALDPSSAVAGISGRVITADGRGIAGAILKIEGGSLEHSKTLITNPFGYYRFEGLEAGQTYVMTVGSKRYLFSKPSRVIELQDNIINFDIVAEP